MIPFTASIAAFDFAARGGVPEEEANAVEGLVANSLRDLGYREVVSTVDVLSMLQLEMVKQRAGCESTLCLAEMAGALPPGANEDGVLASTAN